MKQFHTNNHHASFCPTTGQRGGGYDEVYGGVGLGASLRVGLELNNHLANLPGGNGLWGLDDRIRTKWVQRLDAEGCPLAGPSVLLDVADGDHTCYGLP